MSSYQKLKAKIAELEAEKIKMLEDQGYYYKEVIRHGVKKDFAMAYWFGGEPVGEVKELEGFWKNLKTA